MLVDTHTHLYDEQFETDREDVIQRAKENGVNVLINAGCDVETSKTCIQLAEQVEGLYAMVGIHPCDIMGVTEATIAEIELLTKHPKVVGIGEIGLDYYWDDTPRDFQQEVLRWQLRLARTLKLPVSIHCRDAYGAILPILKEEHIEEMGGVMHCFSGSLEMAHIFMNMNLHISFGGPVTFKNAHKTQAVAKEIPLERLLIETDAPYLTPTPYRGKRNESGYVKYIAEKIAHLKGVNFETVAQATTQNAYKLFGLDKRGLAPYNND